MEFYILNQNEEVTATLSTDSTGEHTPVYSAVVDEKLGSYDTLELSIPSGVEHDLDIKEEYFIVFEDVKGFREYIINEVVDVDDGEISRTITAELSSIELLDEIIQTNLTGNNPTTILTSMLKNTRWIIGNIDPSIYNSAFTEETEMVSVLEGIDLLSSSFNAEVSFSYAVAGNKITKRFVNLHKQMGANNGKRFEVDKDVTSIKRTIDTSSIKTAIIPFGAEPEEGKARLNIKDLVWSKAAGNPVDKPKGQEWIGDPTALANWGKNNADGSRRHRFLAQEINVETAAELATMAWVQLGQYTKPKTTYEAVAMDLYTLTGDEDLKHEYVNLGDTVVITDFYFAQPLVVQTRVSELKRDLLEPLNNDLVFGDSLELFSTSKQADRLQTIKKELSNRIELVRQAADGKSDSYLGSQEPISPNEKDMWYRPHPTIPNETQFLIFNGLTWDIVLDTSNLDSVGKEVIEIIEQADRDREQAEADFESAKTAAKAYTDTKASEFDTKVEVVKTDLAATKIKADKAVSDSATAIADAGFAKVDATTAKQNAVTAISTAETAKTNAATAISTANTAKTNAGTALTAAQTAVANSGTALTNAQTALDRVGEVEEDTGTLQTSYDALTQTVGLKADKTTVNGITQTVTQQGLDITANATAVGLKADKTAVDTINQTVIKHTTDIKATADGLALKSDKSVVDSINSTVNTHTSQIKATSDGLALKADSSFVNTVKGTVDTHTTQIKATSDGLALKAEKSLVDSINSTVGTHTTQIKATSDGLALKAEKSLVDTVKSTVDTHTTQITATSNGLALKADSSLVNTINGTVNTHTGQISANSTAIAARLTSAQVDSLVAAKKYVNETTLNATASGLSTSITQVSTDLSNLDINDRNLTTGTGSDFKIVTFSGWDYYFPWYNDVKAGETFTARIWVEPTNRPVRVQLEFDDGSGQNRNQFTGNTIPQGSVGYVTVTATAIISGRVRQSIRHTISEPSPNQVKYKEVKMQRGNKATQWTPAIEDMATLEKFTTLEATVNGINTVVGTKASQTQVTQLATQISTKVESAAYNSKMTQLDSAINLRVVQGDVTAAILADKTVKDTRNDNQLPSWYNTNYPKQTVNEFKYSSTMVIPGFTANYGTLETKVIWNSTAGGVITQVFSSADGVFQRTSNAAYTAWLAWDKIAETGKLISQINVSTEGILLQGKRIQLDGDVTMTSAFVTDIKAKSLEAVYADIATLKTKVLTADVITSTMLKSDTALITKLFATDANVNILTAKTAFITAVKAQTIAADKITAGTLNAANVNIINLNVNNLVGNTTDFVKSQWNKLSSSVNIDAGGVTTTATSGAQTLLQNGVLYVKSTAGQGLGTIGAALDGNENLFSIDIVNNQSFTIRYQTATGSTTYKDIIGYYDYLGTVVINNATQINGWLRMNGALDMQQSDILAARYITAGVLQTGTIGSILNDGNRIAAKGISGVSLGVGGQVNGGFARIFWLDGTTIYAEKNLSMQKNTITNQSDKRLKKNIVTSSKNAMDSMRKWNFVDYEWIDNEENKGVQFGLIAQDTPELMTYGEEHDFYSLDTSRQIMLNSKVGQELVLRTDKHETKFAELEEKYELLKQKIDRMENITNE